MSKYIIRTDVGASTFFRTSDGGWGTREEAYRFDSFDVASQVMEFLIKEEMLDKDDTCMVIYSDY